MGFSFSPVTGKKNKEKENEERGQKDRKQEEEKGRGGDWERLRKRELKGLRFGMQVVD